MSGTDAFIWFVATTIAVVSLLTVGTYLAVNSYARARGVIHLPRRHG